MLRRSQLSMIRLCFQTLLDEEALLRGSQDQLTPAPDSSVAIGRQLQIQKLITRYPPPLKRWGIANGPFESALTNHTPGNRAHLFTHTSPSNHSYLLQREATRFITSGETTLSQPTKGFAAGKALDVSPSHLTTPPRFQSFQLFQSCSGLQPSTLRSLTDRRRGAEIISLFDIVADLRRLCVGRSGDLSLSGIPSQAANCKIAAALGEKDAFEGPIESLIMAILATPPIVLHVPYTVRLFQVSEGHPLGPPKWQVAPHKNVQSVGPGNEQRHFIYFEPQRRWIHLDDFLKVTGATIDVTVPGNLPTGYQSAQSAFIQSITDPLSANRKIWGDEKANISWWVPFSALPADFSVPVSQCLELTDLAAPTLFYFLSDAIKVAERLRSYSGSSHSAKEICPPWGLYHSRPLQFATPTHYLATTKEQLSFVPCVEEAPERLQDEEEDMLLWLEVDKTDPSESSEFIATTHVGLARRLAYREGAAEAMVGYGLDVSKHKCWFPQAALHRSFDRRKKGSKGYSHPVVLQNEEVPAMALYRNHSMFCIDINDTARLGSLFHRPPSHASNLEELAMVKLRESVKIFISELPVAEGKDTDDTDTLWLLLPRFSEAESESTSTDSENYEWRLASLDRILINFGAVRAQTVLGAHHALVMDGESPGAYDWKDSSSSTPVAPVETSIHPRYAQGKGTDVGERNSSSRRLVIIEEGEAAPLLVPVSIVAKVARESGYSPIAAEPSGRGPAHHPSWVTAALPILNSQPNTKTKIGDKTFQHQEDEADRLLTEEAAALQESFPLVMPETQPSPHQNIPEDSSQPIDEAAYPTFAMAHDPHGLYILEVAEAIFCVNAAHLKLKGAVEK